MNGDEAGAPLPLTVLYRGPLSSCNFDCGYCPFAKRRDPPAELRVDRLALERFLGWCEAAGGGEASIPEGASGAGGARAVGGGVHGAGGAQGGNAVGGAGAAAGVGSPGGEVAIRERASGAGAAQGAGAGAARGAGAADGTLSVFFTPWGEALVRSWYRDAMVRLSRMPYVRRVAVQTNLSATATWLDEAVCERVGVWATWHPSQTPMERFVRRARRVQRSGAHLSVGIVGLPEHWEAAQRLRDELDGIYVWVNAVKRDSAAMALDWGSVDPLFSWNAQAWPSVGKTCRTGEDVVTVDGAGDVRRCHFVTDVIGNLYDGSLAAALKPRACPNAECGCHIGYVHMPELGLDGVFGEGILERVRA